MWPRMHWEHAQCMSHIALGSAPLELVVDRGPWRFEHCTYDAQTIAIASTIPESCVRDRISEH